MIGLVNIVIGYSNLDPEIARPHSSHRTYETTHKAREEMEKDAEIDYTLVWQVPFVEAEDGEKQNAEQIRERGDKRRKNRFYALLSKIWRGKGKSKS